jgi:hypothetical protein
MGSKAEPVPPRRHARPARPGAAHVDGDGANPDGARADGADVNGADDQAPEGDGHATILERSSPATGRVRLAGGARRDLVLVGVALLPFAVSAVAQVLDAASYHPLHDLAATELTVRDVGRHEVLVGLFSRSDWSHPGPLSFYLLAPFYWITGGSALGLVLGALAVNSGSVAGIAVVARRRGGTPLLVCASSAACCWCARSAAASPPATGTSTSRRCLSPC